MAASEIVTVSGTIVQIATAIQTLGNNWYAASSDWEDFPRKIARLQRKHDFWKKEFTKSGLSFDPSLMNTLREAETLLEMEKAKLKRRQARCGAGCWSKLSMTMFPAKVGLRIQLAIDAFDAIPGFLQMEEEGAIAVEKRMMRRTQSLPIRNDDRYVPLKATQTRVQNALEDPNGSPIVLLHGGPGKGKSTLAGYVALHYQSILKNPDSPFELVVFLECGPEADTLTSQFRLLQLLGSSAGAAAAPQELGQPSSNLAIKLSGLLKYERILIIFDDIWKREFLHDMLHLCGVAVKCLVTSQDRDLCLGLSHPAIQIQIENVKPDVAMQILASHVGFTNKLIPAHIQGEAQKLIQHTEGTPLALASVAKAIDSSRADELVEWEAASQNLLQWLDSNDTFYTMGMKYSKSFWAATQLCIKSLKEDAQKLLLLVYMCDDGTTSVPEEVLHFLYLRAVFRGGSETFEKSRRDLESRGLVKISSQTREYNSLEKQRSWSLHSLQKQFIQDELSGRKETALKLSDDKERPLKLSALKGTLVKVLGRVPDGTIIEGGVQTKSTPEFSQEEDIRVRICLCDLYFDEKFSKEIVLKMDSLPKQLNNLRRTAIEPITRLFGLPMSRRWTKAAQSSAKQIFLKYIYDSALHNSGILDLLALPISILPMLHALEGLATVVPLPRTLPLIDENSGDLSKALLDLVGDLSNTGDAGVATATAAARALAQLSSSRPQKGVIISSGILDTILKILSSDSHADLQLACAHILINLSFDDNETDKIAKHPRILAVLVNSLCNENNPYSQIAAARTLQILAIQSEEFVLTVINYPGALEQLVKMLSKDNRPELQLQVAHSLRKLAFSGNDMAVLKLVNFPGLLDELVNLLSQDKNVDLQHAAAEALMTMARTRGDETRLRMKHRPGLLEQFLNAFSEDKHLLTRGWAVRALIFVDPDRGNAARLHSASAYKHRGYANMILGLNKESLEDLNRAHEIEPGDPDTLRHRRTVRARLGDFQGALTDSNSIIEKDRTPFDLQERGILRRMMEDLPAALADLNKCLESHPDDYEVLKHKAYVRFLMKENGARSDAERALVTKPSRVDQAGYGRDCLGTTSVEFLNFQLR